MGYPRNGKLSSTLINFIGKKDVPSILLPTRDKATSAEEKFESLPIPQGATGPEIQRSLAISNGDNIYYLHQINWKCAHIGVYM